MSDSFDGWPTVGERLAGRLLRKEKLEGSAVHFKPGQHEAVIYPWSVDYSTKQPVQVARLTYVDSMGHLCCVLVARGAETEPWEPTWVGRAGQYTASETSRAPASFRLSEKMLAALTSARHEDYPSGTHDDGAPVVPESASGSPGGCEEHGNAGGTATPLPVAEEGRDV